MKLKGLLLPALAFCFLACGCSKDELERGIYEGLTSDMELKGEEGEEPDREPMTYDQYRMERERIIKEGKPSEE